MKRIALLITILLFGFITLFAQKVNQFDTNNKRHGIWKKKYNSGRIRYQGEFNHGKEIGVFKFYSPSSSKQPIIIKEFSLGSETATVAFYTVGGILKSKGTMIGKKHVGRWIYFHKDGKTIMQEEHYLNDELNGDYKTFFPNKKPTIITTYKKGKLHGNYKRYSIKNALYQDLNYIDGKLNGEAVYYDRKTGKITEKGKYVNDERVGTWDFYVDGEFNHSHEIIKQKHSKN